MEEVEVVAYPVEVTGVVLRGWLVDVCVVGVNMVAAGVVVAVTCMGGTLYLMSVTANLALLASMRVAVGVAV